MNYQEDKQISDAISVIDWMKDEINRLESDNEKLEEREKELIDEIDDLKKQLADKRIDK